MIQVTKVWWDGEKLMAEPIDPTTIYQEPAQEKYWNAVSDAHIAAIKKSSKAMVEDAVVRAAQKVMAEFEAKSDERLMKDWGPGPHEYHSLPAQQWSADVTPLYPKPEPGVSIKAEYEQPAQQEPVAWQYRDSNDDGTWGAWLGCDKCLAEDEYRQVRALYTSPPAQRTWQGLTDEEIEQGCKQSWVTEQAWQSAVWWAEAKLKEKNNG